MTTWRHIVGAFAVLVAASVTGWALAFPQSSPAATSVRALADGAAVLTFGLALVSKLDDPHFRADAADAARKPLAMAAGVWAVAELVRVVVAAAAASDRSLTSVSLSTCIEFAVHTAGGRSAVVSILAATAVGGVALAATPRGPVGFVVSAVAAAGIVARALAGHLADDVAGVLAVAVHVVSAAAWCGVLAALAVTVSGHEQWARVLPKFSRLSLLAVTALLASGAFGAIVMLQSVSDLWATGYGRVLAAKLATMALLLALGWRNRTHWVPAAQARSLPAAASNRRSRVEVSVMTAAVGLAAALAVTA